MAVKNLFASARWTYRKLKENNAFGVLLHPSVIANYLRYQREQREQPIVMRSQPYGIEIEMTNRCNLACTQCFRSLGLKPYKLGDMDPDNYIRILKQFPYAMNISLNGFGEPLMYAPFFDIVALTRRMRPWAKIGIYTNGQLLDEAKAEKAISSGLTEINVSVDAARPASYRRVRRGGRLEPLHANIRRLLAVRERARARFPRVGLNFVMVNDNEGELPEFVEQAVDLGVDYINCISWAAYDWGFRNRRSADSYLQELEAAQARMLSLGIECRSMPEISTAWTQEERPFSCNFFWGYSFRVTYDGSVTLGCCTPFRETYCYGNLLETDFWEIWNGPKIRKNREMAKQGIVPNRVCASCDIFCKSFFTSLHTVAESVTTE